MRDKVSEAAAARGQKKVTSLDSRFFSSPELFAPLICNIQATVTGDLPTVFAVAEYRVQPQNGPQEMERN